VAISRANDNQKEEAAGMPMSIGSRTRRMMATLLMLSLALVLPARAADYDLVINYGRVIDAETMLDAVMNVGEKDGKVCKNSVQ